MNVLLKPKRAKNQQPKTNSHKKISRWHLLAGDFCI